MGASPNSACGSTGFKTTEFSKFCLTYSCFKMKVIHQKLTFNFSASARLHSDHTIAGNYLLTNHLGRCGTQVPGSAGRLREETAFFMLQWHSRRPPPCLSLSSPHVNSLASWHLDTPPNTLPRAFAWSLTMLSAGPGGWRTFQLLQLLILAHTSCFLFVLFWAQMDPSEANL